MAKLIKKNAFKPEKGQFYYIKNGSIYATPCCWAKKSKPKAKKSAPKKRKTAKK